MAAEPDPVRHVAALRSNGPSGRSARADRTGLQMSGTDGGRNIADGEMAEWLKAAVC